MIEHLPLPFEPPDPLNLCCMESVQRVDKCSCWIPIVAPYPSERIQEGPSLARLERCRDCAYRLDSPERSAAEGEELPYAEGSPFFCHEGMPSVRFWVHPSGAVRLPEGGDDYMPIVGNRRTWQADGRPAVVCAGWAAVDRRAQAAATERGVK